MEERAEAERVEAILGQSELLANRDGDPLHAQRVTRGVGILGLDRGVQALDRLE